MKRRVSNFNTKRDEMGLGKREAVTFLGRLSVVLGAENGYVIR
jgi:hypothetical protein